MAVSSIPNMAPHADEYAEGHLGRIAILNSFKSAESCLRSLGSRLQWRGHANLSPTPVEVLSKFAGIDSRLYIRLHTLLAFSCFAVVEDKRAEDGGWSREVQFRNGMCRVRRGAYFCAGCVDEDKWFRGYSYWRRSHQLPGMFWCEKHPNERLSEVVSDNPFSRLPQNWIDDSQTSKHDFASEIQHHPMVARFNECCQTMLDNGKSRDSQVARRSLGNMALLAGLNVYASTESNEYPRLSDLVGSIFPTEWVKYIAPYCSEKKFGEYYSEIDGALLAGANSIYTIGTAFALTLSFDSMGAAFKSIDTMCQSISSRPEKISHPDFMELVKSFKINRGYSFEKFNQLKNQMPVSV